MFWGQKEEKKRVFAGIDKIPEVKYNKQKGVIAMKKVIVYGSPMCPHCVEAKEILDKEGSVMAMWISLLAWPT